jgi:hypothetical protein
MLRLKFTMRARTSNESNYMQTRLQVYITCESELFRRQVKVQKTYSKILDFINFLL